MITSRSVTSQSTVYNSILLYCEAINSPILLHLSPRRPMYISPYQVRYGGNVVRHNIVYF